MRFSLRTLIVVMLLAGPLGPWGWRKWKAQSEAANVTRWMKLNRPHSWRATDFTPNQVAAP